MKKYKLNQDYIDRQCAMVSQENRKAVLREAERRLNEQANDCRPYIAAWSILTATVGEIHDILVDWNNHTLASHIKVIADLWTEALNRADLKQQTVLYRRTPTKADSADTTLEIAVPFSECIEGRGEDTRLKRRVKRNGHWFTY